MNHARTLLFAAAAGAASLASCGKDEAAAASVDVTLGLPAMQNRPADWSEARANLGEKLFFDTRLSANGKMSCSTCHQHEYGWTDGKQFSQKVDGTMNTRNSPSLYDVGYQPYFYWDGRAPTLAKNIGAAWMGHMIGGDEAKQKQIVEAVAGVGEYESAFQSAYGGAPTVDRIVDALCDFVYTLQAGGTRFDQWSAGEASAVTAEERSGWELFNGKAQCSTCHVPPLFTDMIFHNVGIGMDAEDPDPGRHKVDENAPLGSFKTPSLRGVTKTAPYFHDGSVATLDEAVHIMAGGGIENPHLDPILQGFHSRTLTEDEIKKIIAFLHTLEPREKFEKPKLP